MKEILKEWRQFLLTEVQTLKLIDLTTSAKENGYSQNDIQLLTQFWNNNDKIRSKYSKVIEKEISDPDKNEPIAHILSAVKSHYNFVYDKLSSTEKMKLAASEDIDVGKLRVQADLAEQEVEDNEDPMKFSSRGIREQCKYRDGRPVVGRYEDFDVVYSGADWVVIEPKSVKGSIAWAHGKPDGSEETEEKYRVTWCTGTKSDNFYETYAINYHMFYCIPVNYEDVKINKPENRRLCLGFINYEGKVYLACDEDLPEIFMDEAVVVDGENDGINKEEVLSVLKNNSLYSNLEKLCSTRKSTFLKEKYKNASYEDVLKATKIYFKYKSGDSENLYKRFSFYIEFCNIAFIEKLLNEDSLDSYDRSELVRLINIIISLRKDLLETEIGRSLIRKLAKDEDVHVRILITQRKDLLELEDSNEIIINLANDKDEHVRRTIAYKKDLLKLEDGKEIVRKLAEDENKYVRAEIAQREYLLELEDGKEIIKNLSEDESKYVRIEIAQREDLLELEDGKEIIRKLAEDENEYIRKTIVGREDLLELEDGKEIIKNLSEDESEYVRMQISQREDLLEADPSGDLIRKLAEDEDEYVRRNIAEREDLLEVDPSGDLIRTLARDESEYVRMLISQRKDLLELEDWKEIIINLLNDEDLSVRWRIVQRDDLDLLEVDPNGDLIRELINNLINNDELDDDPYIVNLKSKFINFLKNKYKSVFNINECLLKKKMSNFLF